jgi:hypothetical protein
VAVQDLWINLRGQQLHPVQVERAYSSSSSVRSHAVRAATTSRLVTAVAPASTRTTWIRVTSRSLLVTDHPAGEIADIPAGLNLP